MVNPANNENLRRRIWAEIEDHDEEDGLVEIDEVEWMLQLLEERVNIKMIIDQHDFQVSQMNTLLDFGRQAEEISGLRPRYFIYGEGENSYPVIEVEEKKYFFPMRDEVKEGYANATLDEEEDEVSFQEIDADEWFLISFNIISNLNRTSEGLGVDLTDNHAKQEAVELIKERSGIRVRFFIDRTTGSLTYSAEKKRGMGFNIPIPHEKPALSEE